MEKLEYSVNLEKLEHGKTYLVALLGRHSNKVDHNFLAYFDKNSTDFEDEIWDFKGKGFYNYTEYEGWELEEREILGFIELPTERMFFATDIKYNLEYLTPMKSTTLDMLYRLNEIIEIINKL